MVYISPNPFYGAFKEDLDLRKFNLAKHGTAGLNFVEEGQHLFLASINPGTPGARTPWWRTRIRGAWLIKIDGTPVNTLTNAQRVFCRLANDNSRRCSLLFLHPETTPDISSSGLPIMSKNDFSQLTHDQLNNRFNLQEDGLRVLRTRMYDIVESGEVLQYVMRVRRLTQGKLLKQEDWSNWQALEFLQLDQYDVQGMFGDPVKVDKDDAVFFLVWTYGVKTLDGHKKARCVCDGLSQSGMVKVLDETYANCVDQTSSGLFHAISAGENLLVFGADVSNAFAEASPPKQGFYVRPNKAFHEWWVQHKCRPPIPPGYVIPALLAMQGHPESPRLWEKHADAILRKLGLTPTTHEPCLYSGNVAGKRVIFKRQVDDFAIAAPDEKTADILLDLIDDQLSIPIKRQGLLDMFNGINVTQTQDYIKIDCHTYIDKFCEKYTNSWLHKVPMTENRPTPSPLTPLGSRNLMLQWAPRILKHNNNWQIKWRLSIKVVLANSSGP